MPDLPTLSRLALGYAPRASREPWAAYLALDARLASFVRAANEPLTAQLRLAWWRETLCLESDQWPSGEPLLGALRSWNGRHGALAILVDGWESMALLQEDVLEPARALADSRARALAALADVLGEAAHGDAAKRMGREWALADIAAKLSNADERELVRTHASTLDWKATRLPRGLRPLAVLHALARRAKHLGTTLDALGPNAALSAMRAGFFGR